MPIVWMCIGGQMESQTGEDAAEKLGGTSMRTGLKCESSPFRAQMVANASELMAGQRISKARSHGAFTMRMLDTAMIRLLSDGGGQTVAVSTPKRIESTIAARSDLLSRDSRVAESTSPNGTTVMRGFWAISHPHDAGKAANISHDRTLESMLNRDRNLYATIRMKALPQ